MAPSINFQPYLLTILIKWLNPA